MEATPPTDKLNPEQRRAVTCAAGNLLVLAGAGTGKTRVLTSRFAWLVQTGRAHAGEILAVTFTNKAAEEMRRRVCTLLNRDSLPASLIGTFHSVAHRLLRRHCEAAGLRGGFQIIDKTEQAAVMRRVLKARGGGAAAEEVRSLGAFVSRCKERGLYPGAVVPDNPNSKRLLPYYELYMGELRAQNKVDFGDLMMMSHALLVSRPDIREEYAARFRHVLVDEFQDTSAFQYEWLKLFRSGDNCFFAVGDDDQSVYGFRSADPRIMQQFRAEFSVGDVVRLETNYRSQPSILAAANALIGHNTERIGKTLRAHGGTPEPLQHRELGTDGDEAEHVTGTMLELAQAGANYETMAVIYRTNAQSRLFEQRLITLGIPYRIYGGLRFFDRREVRDAMAYLRLAVDSGDREAMDRVINHPPRGIGAKTLAQVRAHPAGMRAGIDDCARSNARVDAFRRLLVGLEDAYRAAPAPSALMRRIIDESGLHDHYGREKEDPARVENLKELVNAARQFENDSREGEADAADFISHASLDTGKSDTADDRGVSLMTAHAAKGLEFETVFLVGLEDGLFPHKRAERPEEKEEERRLMYVALTRAKRNLYLTHARSRMEYGSRSPAMASRFLGELPGDLFAQQLLAPPASKANVCGHRRSARPAPAGAPGLARGSQVFHPKFGGGVVLGIQPGANAPVVEVYFKNKGRKKIDTSIVSLKTLP